MMIVVPKPVPASSAFANVPIWSMYSADVFGELEAGAGAWEESLIVVLREQALFEGRDHVSVAGDRFVHR